jgi:type I site-specific restriction-modification system R (restriction) subunit
MSLISEKRDIQDQLISYLQGIGWSYLPPLTVAKERGNDPREPFLPNVLRDLLIKLNPGLVTPDSVADIIAGNEALLNALCGHWTVAHPTEKQEYNLTLIAYDNLNTNLFHFTQELLCDDKENNLPIS